MALKTDYKDDIFSGNRKYAQIDNGDGTISFTDQTEYDQVGDTFGATQINEIDASINDLNSELTAGNTKFYFDSQGGKWGWNSSPARGAGTFHPFRASHTQTYNIYAHGVADLGEFHEYRYINTNNIPVEFTFADRDYTRGVSRYDHRADWYDSVAVAGWTYVGSAIMRTLYNGTNWKRPAYYGCDYDSSGNIHAWADSGGWYNDGEGGESIGVTVRHFYTRVR